MPFESARALAPVKLWRPRRLVITPAAGELAHGRSIAEKAAALGAEVIELSSNRLRGLTSDDLRQAYRSAKTTLAVLISPASKRKLQSIPPSADWRFDLAEGSGSLSILLSRRFAQWPPGNPRLCQHR